MKEIDGRMLEYARTLKEYCRGFGGDCTECLFDNDDECVLCAYTPGNWSIEDLSKAKAVELLKEMRENISELGGNEAKNKVTALTMAIEALEG